MARRAALLAYLHSPTLMWLLLWKFESDQWERFWLEHSFDSFWEYRKAIGDTFLSYIDFSEFTAQWFRSKSAKWLECREKGIYKKIENHKRQNTSYDKLQILYVEFSKFWSLILFWNRLHNPNLAKKETEHILDKYALSTHKLNSEKIYLL